MSNCAAARAKVDHQVEPAVARRGERNRAGRPRPAPEVVRLVPLKRMVVPIVKQPDVSCSIDVNLDNVTNAQLKTLGEEFHEDSPFSCSRWLPHS